MDPVEASGKIVNEEPDKLKHSLEEQADASVEVD
jgi:hypothetical protein